MQNKYKAGRLYELDALRGVAALVVVFIHYTMDRPQFNSLWYGGLIAVDTFFIISGFVIFMTLERCRTVKEFIIKRFARLYPAYWICMTLTTLTLLLFGFEHLDRGSGIKYLANLTMVQRYLGQVDMDGVYWTLTIEFCFYILVIGVLILKAQKQIERIIIACLLVLTAAGLYTHYHMPSAEQRSFIYYFAAVFIVLPQFLAGICFYRLMFKGKSLRRYLLIIGCFLTMIALRRLDVRIIHVGSPYYFSLLAIVYVLFFLFVNGRLQFIVNRFSIFLGKISYPLYLIHMNAGLLVVLPRINLYVSYWYAMLLTMAVMVFVAYLVHRLVEKPAQRWIKRKMQMQEEMPVIAGAVAANTISVPMVPEATADQ